MLGMLMNRVTAVAEFVLYEGSVPCLSILSFYYAADVLIQTNEKIDKWNDVWMDDRWVDGRREKLVYWLVD